MSVHQQSQLAISIQFRHLYRIIVWFNLNILAGTACGDYYAVTVVLMAHIGYNVFYHFYALFELAWEYWYGQTTSVSPMDGCMYMNKSAIECFLFIYIYVFLELLSATAMFSLGTASKIFLARFTLIRVLHVNRRTIHCIIK